MIHGKFLFLGAVAAMICFLCTTGCSKMSDNGELDGMWQITHVSKCNNGTYGAAVDVKNEKAYLSFQLQLAQIKWLSKSFQGSSTILARFQHRGDSLRLYNFYRHFRTTDSLFTAKDTLLLSPLGFKGFENKFKVLEIGEEDMKLQSTFARIELRKL